MTYTMGSPRRFELDTPLSVLSVRSQRKIALILGQTSDAHISNVALRSPGPNYGNGRYLQYRLGPRPTSR